MNTLTYEKLMHAKVKLDGIPRPEVYNQFKFQGYDIHILPERQVPKVQVSENFKWLTDEARERINNKLIELLGYKDATIIPKDRAYMFNNAMIMRPETAAMLINCTA